MTEWHVEPTEEQLLSSWQLAEARIEALERDSDRWRAAMADAWRAQIAYRDAVGARLRRQQDEERSHRKRLGQHIPATSEGRP